MFGSPELFGAPRLAGSVERFLNERTTTLSANMLMLSHFLSTLMQMESQRKFLLPHNISGVL